MLASDDCCLLWLLIKCYDMQFTVMSIFGNELSMVCKCWFADARSGARSDDLKLSYVYVYGYVYVYVYVYVHVWINK